MTITVTVKRAVPVKYLRCEIGVRYWDDAKVNSIQDGEDGHLIPLRQNSIWHLTIDMETGVVEDWPIGIVADVHYKVCDAGIYELLDEQRNHVVKIDGYVPRMLSPKGNGYGDYVIMTIDGSGKIDGWKVDLSPFEDAA